MSTTRPSYTNTGQGYGQASVVPVYGAQQSAYGSVGYVSGQAPHVSSTPSSSAHESSQWVAPQNPQPAPQSWSPIPPPLPPRPAQSAAQTYNPNVYGMMPGASSHAVPPPPPPKDPLTLGQSGRNSYPPHKYDSQHGLATIHAPAPSFSQTHQAQAEQTQHGWPQQASYSSRPTSHQYEPENSIARHDHSGYYENYNGQSTQHPAYDYPVPPPPYQAHSAPYEAQGMVSSSTIGSNGGHTGYVPPSLPSRLGAAYAPGADAQRSNGYGAGAPPPVSPARFDVQQQPPQVGQNQDSRYSQPMYGDSYGNSSAGVPENGTLPYAGSLAQHQQYSQHNVSNQSMHMPSMMESNPHSFSTHHVPAQGVQQPQHSIYTNQTGPWQSTSQTPSNAVLTQQTQYNTQQYPTHPTVSTWNVESSQNQLSYAAQGAHLQANGPNVYSYTSRPLEDAQQDWPPQDPLMGEQGSAVGRHYSYYPEQPIQAPTPLPGQLSGRQAGHTGQYLHNYETMSSVSDGPVSPIQHRESISFSQTVEDQQRRQEFHRPGSIPVAKKAFESYAQSINTPVSQVQAITPTNPGGATGASALGQGGPSDWEHYGPSTGEEIDDTAEFSQQDEKDAGPASPQQPAVVELPTHPSPPIASRHRSESSAVSLPSEEDWPTPSAVAPLNIRRPVSSIELNEAYGGDSPHSSSAPRTAALHQHDASAVSEDNGLLESQIIDAMHRVNFSDREQSENTIRQQWLLEQPYQQQQPGSVEPSSAYATSSPKPATIGWAVISAPPANTFIVDDGGWMPSNDVSAGRKTQHAQLPSVVPEAPEHLDVVSLHAAGSAAVDYGDWAAAEGSHASQANPSEPAPTSPGKRENSDKTVLPQVSNSFIVDDGGRMPTSAPAVPERVGSEVKEAPDVPDSGFVIDDGTGPPLADRTDERAAAIALESAAQKQEHSSQGPDTTAGLDPWYAASLKRFKEMLHRESDAGTADEKTKIFKEFVAEELTIRGIHIAGLSGPSDRHSASEEDTTAAAEQDGSSGDIKPNTSASTQRPKLSSPIPSQPYVWSTQVDEEEYSPGGRPILSRIMSRPQDIRVASPNSAGSRPPTAIPARGLGIESAQPPKPHPEDAPIPVESPSMPVYKPYRHSVTASGSEPSTHSAILTPASSSDDENNKAFASEDEKVEQPPYKPYSPNEHRTSVASIGQPRASSSTATPTLLDSTNREHQGTLLDHADHPKPESPPPPTFPEANPPHHNPLQALQSLLPPSSPSTTGNPHPHLTSLTTQTASLASDYTWLTILTTTFSTRAAATRQRLETERRQRQSDAEALHDDLFNANEINYADLGVLEEEVREQEMERKAEEDKQEMQEYISEVFEPVSARLQNEIGVLGQAVDEAVALLPGAAAGKRGVWPDEDERTGEEGKLLLLPVLDEILALHRRIEERHERLVQASTDRDKRAKRTELQALYARGEIVRMKEVERGFERREKEAGVRAAGQKRERVERILGVVEEAATRGLGENQDFVDEVVEGLEMVRGWMGGLDGHVEGVDMLETLRRAEEVVKLLSQGSAKFVRVLHAAEVGISDAEFAVEAAKARLEGVDEAGLKKIEEQKKGEERKIDEELETRSEAIRHDLKDVEGLIDELRGMYAQSTPVK